MYNILLAAVIVISVIMVITIMMQPSKQNSAASAFTGGADQLFGKQKARGFEAVMQRFNCHFRLCMDGLAISFGLFVIKIIG